MSATANDLAARQYPSSAPGPYLGFALQPVRLCYHLLLGNPKDIVTIEGADDITVATGGGIILEQNKSALSQNPISDWANDLWKTFANWVVLIQDGHVDPATTAFRL